MYNNLDPDTKAFNSGWDALNRFVKYFNVNTADAREWEEGDSGAPRPTEPVKAEPVPPSDGN